MDGHILDPSGGIRDPRDERELKIEGLPGYRLQKPLTAKDARVAEKPGFSAA
jgi:hypothetical protein